MKETKEQFIERYVASGFVSNIPQFHEQYEARIVELEGGVRLWKAFDKNEWCNRRMAVIPAKRVKGE